MGATTTVSEPTVSVAPTLLETNRTDVWLGNEFAKRSQSLVICGSQAQAA